MYRHVKAKKKEKKQVVTELRNLFFSLFFLNAGSPGSPLKTSVSKSASGLTIDWIPGDTGGGRVTGYVIEARPSGVYLYSSGKCRTQQIVGSGSFYMSDANE